MKLILKITYHIYETIILTGPLIPFIITRFIYPLKKDKLTNRIFIDELIILAILYLIILLKTIVDKFYYEELIRPYLGGFIFLLFNLIFLPIRAIYIYYHRGN